MKGFVKGNLAVRVFPTRQEMGAAAAQEGRGVPEAPAGRRARRSTSCSPPRRRQNELLAGLVASDVDWSRVHAFHMDDYVGLPADDPRRFPIF